MEVEVAKFRDALEIVRPAVPRKSALPAITHVLLGNGQIVGGDLESAVIVSLPGAQDPCLLPIEAVIQLLKYIPGSQRMTLEVKRGKVNITWPEGSATFSADNPKDYPPVPGITVTAEADIAGDSLIEAISSVLPYCATEQTRPVLSGITVVLGESIQVCAGDGFRMAYESIPLAFPLAQTIVIPATGAKLMLHLWAKTPRTPPSSNDLIPVITAKKKLAVALADGNILRVGFGPAAQVLIKLIQGSPPDWLKLIPTTPPILQARVLAPDFERAVKRVRDVARDGKGIVRLQFSEASMTVSSKADSNVIEAVVPLVNSEGEPNKTAVNVNYLLGYLSGKQGIVTISLTSTTSPVSFQHRSSPRVIVMPMFVEW
ncbi:Beta sliding clamp [subsurface metagenome]